MPAMIHNVAARVSTPSARPLSDSVKRQTRLARFLSTDAKSVARVQKVAPRRHRAAAAGEDGVSLTEAEREELRALEESGDAFERLVQLAKEGGVDIPPPVNAAAIPTFD